VKTDSVAYPTAGESFGISGLQKQGSVEKCLSPFTAVSKDFDENDWMENTAPCDHLRQSNDSRLFGAVHRSAIHSRIDGIEIKKGTSKQIENG